MLNNLSSQQAFRHVKFEGLPSLPSRCSSSHISKQSRISPEPILAESINVKMSKEYLQQCMVSVRPKWDQVMKAVEKASKHHLTLSSSEHHQHKAHCSVSSSLCFSTFYIIKHFFPVCFPQALTVLSLPARQLVCATSSGPCHLTCFTSETIQVAILLSAKLLVFIYLYFLEVIGTCSFLYSNKVETQQRGDDAFSPKKYVMCDQLFLLNCGQSIYHFD